MHSYLYGYWFNDWRPALVNQIQQAFQPTQPPAPGTLNFNTQGYASIDIDNVQYSYEYNGQRIDGYDLTPYDQYYQTWNKTTPDFSAYREQYNLMIPSVEQPNNINVQQMFSNVQNINDLINMLPIPNTGALQPIKDILNALEDLGIFQALDFASEMFSALTQVIGNAVTAAEYGQFLDVSTHQYNLFQLFEANETAINNAMENASRWNPNTPLGYNGVDISVATTANGNYLQSNGIVQYISGPCHGIHWISRNHRIPHNRLSLKLLTGI